MMWHTVNFHLHMHSCGERNKTQSQHHDTNTVAASAGINTCIGLSNSEEIKSAALNIAELCFCEDINLNKILQQLIALIRIDLKSFLDSIK